MTAIHLDQLSKSIRNQLRSTLILDQLSLTVEEGEIFGFLGANGAGKTTTLKIIMGLIAPSEGHVSLFGQDARQAQARKPVGFLPEHPQFPRNLSAPEFLKLSAQLAQCPVDKKQLTQTLERVGLGAVGKKKIAAFSKGMQQRLGIAQTLLGDPKLLILDEPMSGLDPLGRQEVAELLLALKHEGKTIFFSTHILSDAQLLCDRMAFLKQGKLLEIYDHAHFSREESLAKLLHVSQMDEKHLHPFSESKDIRWKANPTGTLHIEVDSEEALWQVLSVIQETKAQLLSISMNPQAIKKYWT